MACKVQAIGQAVHSLERATVRLAKTVRNNQVEYSGRSPQVAQRRVASTTMLGQMLRLKTKRSICPSSTVTRDCPKRAAKKQTYLLYLHYNADVCLHDPKARSFHSALLERVKEKDT